MHPPAPKSSRVRLLARLRGQAGAQAAALAWAIALNLLLLGGGAFIVVVHTLTRSEPEFVARPAKALPQRKLEHRAAVAEWQQTVSKPPLLEKLAVASLLPNALPPLPTVPNVDLQSPLADDFLAADAQALLGASGLLGATAGLRAAKSAASFFGVEDSGERIVVIVNTSASVVRKARRRGVTIEKLHGEVVQLVDGLAPSALFGVVQFSQATRAFAGFLAPATSANKEALRRWVPENLRGNPPPAPGQKLWGHEAALAAALALEPDVIFLVTDGQLERRTESAEGVTYPRISYAELARTVRAERRRGARAARIHVIGFEMSAAAMADMKRLAREFGGQVREF